MDIAIMTIEDYDDAIELWRTTPGMGLHGDVDSREGIRAYLERNPGLSLVARENGRLVATLLAGHDGRRGYLHHLAVAQSHRKRGIGKALVERALHELARRGIPRCHGFVYVDNTDALGFWRRMGWKERSDLKVVTTLTKRND